MKQIIILAALLSITAIGSSQMNTKSLDYPITPVLFSDVEIQDEFWSKKIRINHDVTIPIAYQKSEESGRIDNFKKAAGKMAGAFGTEYTFDDTDIYKIIEAASYSIQTYPDAAMEEMMDTLITWISEAQEEDGYLFTSRTIKEGEGHRWNGEKRWEKVNELSHELYNLGHMFEAAAAHYNATGKNSFLDIAIKSADLIVDTFGPGKLENYPGHQEVEIGLVKLYRITGNRAYLDLAKYFLDARGMENVGRPDKYNQSHIPVIDQTTAVGHAVRASYMWTAMADVAAITGNNDYVKAINTLWEDVSNTQYYINGGIGSTSSHEGFGGPYVLPNMTAYNETCAGVGNSTWNHRMFLMTGDSKYMDILERTMYNNILTGVSHTGDRFFYPNPLSSRGQHERSEWFGCACCPPNVARFLPSMPGYMYAQRDRDIFISLYISSETEFELPEGMLSISQKSGMPWNGYVSIVTNCEQPVQANIKLRIPGWARSKPVPGDLYSYINPDDRRAIINLNGEKIEYEVDGNGFVNLNRTWAEDDKIDISFPFEIRKVAAHENVTENHQKIAIERGPLLYCAEWADNDGEVLNLIFDESAALTLKKEPTLFEGITTIEGSAKKAKRSLEGNIIVSDSQPLKLIPYFLWNNRGPGEMLVWLPISAESAIPTPAPTIAAKSEISASRRSRTLYAVADQEVPSASSEKNGTFFHWWPRKGTWEWVQFDFEKPETISEVSVYWLDDRPDGGTRIPAEWEVVYSMTADSHSGNGNSEELEWLPVNGVNGYTVTLDAFDKAKFEEVKASHIRVRVKLSETHSAGIHEIIIK